MSPASDYIRAVVDQCPIVDGHCHNLVNDEGEGALDMASCFSEAQGGALKDVEHTLAFKRGIRELAALLHCEPSLEAVRAAHKTLGGRAVAKKVFSLSKVSALLIDDGLRLPGILPVEAHQKFVPETKRIMRIERVAEDILVEGLRAGKKFTLRSLLNDFSAALHPLPENVVALKSIAAYRRGLAINPHVPADKAEQGLEETLRQEPGSLRLADPHLLSALFLKALEIAAAKGIPLQLHTGFGDRDLDLAQSNPLLLRAVLEDERFRSAQIVLLHCAYPFTREAGYLCSVYENVYLDIGLVFGKLSSHGARAAIVEALEAAPTNKIMFSTDGYAFAESFHLGLALGQESLSHALLQSVHHGDLSLPQAAHIARAILYTNSELLYSLTLPPLPPLPPAPHDGPDAAHHSARRSHASTTSSPNVVKPRRSITDASCSEFVRILLVEPSGQKRMRIVPLPRFSSLVTSSGVGITKAICGMTSFADAPEPATGLSGVGEVRLVPDLSTLRPVPWLPDHQIVLGDLHSVPGQPWEFCPRSTLKRVAGSFKEEFGLEMSAGFESEFYLLHKQTDPSLIPVDRTPYCSSSAFDAMAPLLSSCVAALEGMGVPVEQLHAEAGGGQFEVSIAHAPALTAADRIVMTREGIAGVANSQGLKATFLPQVFSNDAASGSHIHMSLWKDGKNVFSADEELPGESDRADGQQQYGISQLGQHFMAGVLFHLPAVLAFTCPHPNSYIRLQPNKWAGAFQCWGFENREAALRANSPPGAPMGAATNFELKASDACGQPHLALAALIAAGADGIRNKRALPDPIDVNPAELPPHNQPPRLPPCLSQATDALRVNSVIRSALGEGLVQCVLAIREAEEKHYKGKKLEEMVTSLVHKY